MFITSGTLPGAVPLDAQQWVKNEKNSVLALALFLVDVMSGQAILT